MYCHAACRGNQASRRLSTCLVVPSGKDKGKIGLLKERMYSIAVPEMLQAIGNETGKGISKIWGYELERSSRNLFHNKKKKTSG